MLEGSKVPLAESQVGFEASKQAKVTISTPTLLLIMVILFNLDADVVIVFKISQLNKQVRKPNLNTNLEPQ